MLEAQKRAQDRCQTALDESARNLADLETQRHALDIREKELEARERHVDMLETARAAPRSPSEESVVDLTHQAPSSDADDDRCIICLMVKAPANCPVGGYPADVCSLYCKVAARPRHASWMSWWSGARSPRRASRTGSALRNLHGICA
jgi:hypothetical protein